MLRTSFSRNPRCYQHRAKIYREIHKFNTSARIINENCDFITFRTKTSLAPKRGYASWSLRKCLPHGRKRVQQLLYNAILPHGRKRVQQLLYNAIRIMSVAELPRSGGPVRVGLCRDSAPSCYINMLKGAFQLF